jgi:hypothetical protein
MAICYHRCCEALAAGFIQLVKEDTKTNLADAFIGPKMEGAVGTYLVLAVGLQSQMFVSEISCKTWPMEVSSLVAVAKGDRQSRR